jgi:hypothetical protein
LTIAATAAAALAAGCSEERPRLSPPLVTLQLDDTVACSPDTLSLTARAEDPDGIDSLWVSVDQAVEGVDGLLQRVFEARLRVPVRAGLVPGNAVDVMLWARDLAGFQDTVRRALGVIAC